MCLLVGYGVSKDTTLRSICRAAWLSFRRPCIIISNLLELMAKQCVWSLKCKGKEKHKYHSLMSPSNLGHHLCQLHDYKYLPIALAKKEGEPWPSCITFYLKRSCELTDCTERAGQCMGKCTPAKTSCRKWKELGYAVLQVTTLLYIWHKYISEQTHVQKDW